MPSHPGGYHPSNHLALEDPMEKENLRRSIRRARTGVLSSAEGEGDKVSWQGLAQSVYRRSEKIISVTAVVPEAQQV